MLSQTQEKIAVQPTTTSELDTNFHLLKEAVLLKRPVLRDIIQKHGAKDLFTYALDYLDVNLCAQQLGRQQEFIHTFAEQVSAIVGPSIAAEAAEQLQKYYFVSTADHHGPICHPYFLNSNLVTSIIAMEHPDPVLKNTIVLSCANISFSNGTFPRGLLFTGSMTAQTSYNQLGFFPNNSATRLSRVYNYPAYTAKDVDRVKERLREMEQKNEITKKQFEKIGTVLNQVYSTDEILNTPLYSHQVTKTNLSLWREMFATSPFAKVPNLLYIELEAVVMALLTSHHMESDTIIHKILFSPEYQDAFTKYFNGIEGGFSEDAQWGTWLFWALPPGEKYCKRMVRKGSTLTAADGSYSVELTPQALSHAMSNRLIFPSSQFSLLILSLYYGLKCLGGFCQVNYLTSMKESYLKMLADLGESEEAQTIADVQTKELGEDLIIAFLEKSNGSLSLATTIDLILNNDLTTWPALTDLTKRLSLEEVLNTMMPEFYKVMYSEVDRVPALSAITSEEIIALTKLSNKIRACVKIP